jgi:hypothetical protein
MFRDNLNLFYNEYRQCIKNQIIPDLDKDDKENNFFKNCLPQKDLIQNFLHSQVEKLHSIHWQFEHHLDAGIDKNLHKFHDYGWSEKRVKNM